MIKSSEIAGSVQYIDMELLYNLGSTIVIVQCTATKQSYQFPQPMQCTDIEFMYNLGSTSVIVQCTATKQSSHFPQTVQYTDI